jgi:FkbM family methyltransferase
VLEALAHEPFGTFAEDDRTRHLRALIRLGLSRGRVTRWIRTRWLAAHGPLVDAKVRGVNYRFDLRDNVTDNKVLLSSRAYDRPEVRALAATAAGGLFVDVGANTGYYTLCLLNGGAARALAVEPNPPTLARLRFNIAANGMADRVTVIPHGVGPEGELEFFQPVALGSASFVRPPGEATSIRVRTRPLLALLAEAGVDAVASLKIDVEGFEDRVMLPFLDQAPARLLPQTVVIEICNADNWQADLLAQFAHKGYRVLQRTRGNLILRRHA